MRALRMKEKGSTSFEKAVGCIAGALAPAAILLAPAALPLVVSAQERVTPVSVVEARMAPVREEIPLTGSVTARRMSLISPKVDGFVARVLVDDGDEVRAGQTLLELDRTMPEIELARVQAQVQEAQLKLKEAVRQRDEAAELRKRKHIASTEYEAAAARAGIDAAALKRLEAELASQRETLRRHTIEAPFDGVIADKLVEVGHWVETGTALMELVEIAVVRVDVPVPQLYFGQVNVGTPVEIVFDALPRRIFAATVFMKVPVGNTTARTFPVKIELRNDDRAIAPGMSARVRFLPRRTGEAVLLPRDAIVKKPDGSESVWRVGEEDGHLKATPVSVKTGRAYRGNVEIIDGALEAGDRIVVRGNEILRPGQTVHVAEVLDASTE